MLGRFLIKRSFLSFFRLNELLETLFQDLNPKCFYQSLIAPFSLQTRASGKLNLQFTGNNTKNLIWT